MATATVNPAQIEGVAQARFIRVSPQKARLVVDLIRGHRAEEALQTLRFTKKRVAREVEKTLRSAIANAERKAEDAGESLDVDALFVTQCFVNEGSRWKRMRPAPMGRGFRYQKRTSHIVVQVAEHTRAAESRVAAAAAEAEASKGVKGAFRKARKTIEKRAKQAQKTQKKKK
jgi:large subunit ribosomal protein L22